MSYITELTLLVLLLVLTAASAASEISVIASSRIKLRRLASGGSRPAKIILKILEAPEKFFGTILVLNNVVNTLIAILVSAAIIHFTGGDSRWGIALATVIASFLIIVTEVTAKTFSVWHAEKVSSFLAGPVRAAIIIFSPLIRGLEIITNAMVNILGGKPKGKPTLVTEEEIKALVKIGEEEGGVHKEKYRMLSKVFDFGETVVRDVMTPKAHMMLVSTESTFDDMLEKVLESGYSRLPVYKGAPENIIGVINTKDLLSLSCNRELIVLEDIIYPASVVRGSKKVTELLKEFQKGHTHLALVTDEKGAVEGLVTLEDLLEEIVGEIEDEYDIRSKPYKKGK